jgi:putative Holliday junction resolvase
MSSKTKLEGDIVGLDLGMSRTGVARLNTIAQIAEPLNEIKMGSDLRFTDQVLAVVTELNASALIVGLPKGLDGQETEQTRWSREKIEMLRNAVSIPIYSMEEAGTTKQAEQRAKPNQSVDSVAAGILLEDFIGAVKDGRIDEVTF